MSEWSDARAKLLVARIGELIVFGQTRTDAVYHALSEALDDAYAEGMKDNMRANQ